MPLLILTILAVLIIGFVVGQPYWRRWQRQRSKAQPFPEAWRRYLQPIPEVERHDLMSAYHRRLTSHDEAVRLSAARAWSVWEASTSFLRQDEAFINSHEDAHFALSFARIECHYFVNGGFFDADDQLLRDAHRLKDIPGVIAHGRYDVVCPVQNAWDLKQAWPGAKLEIAPTSGHSAFEPELVDILVRATDGFR